MGKLCVYCGDSIYKFQEQINNLIAIAEAIRKLPFGESMALPWCRESFPELDTVMKEYEIAVDKSEG